MVKLTEDGEHVTLSTRDKIELTNRIEQAVKRGMQDAMSDEAVRGFWTTGVGVLKEEVAQRTGQFILKGLTAVLARLFFFLLIGVVVYALGGWGLVTGIGRGIIHIVGD